MGYSKKTNKPTENGGKAATGGAPSAQWSSRVRPVAIAAIVVILAAAAFLVVKRGTGNGEQRTADKEKKVQRQRTAKPIQVPSTTTTLESVATPRQKTQSELSKREKQLKEIRDKFGDNIPENLKATVYFLEHPPKQTFKVQSNADFLRHTSERRIAGVALVEPGTFFVMKPEFDESFDKDFINALVDKIEINDDDSDETRAIKEGVIALKKEIAEICKVEGKTPSEVMNEHAETMYELGKFQRELEKELERIHMNEEYSDKDVEDFCEAANELLKSKGLAPIQHIDLTRRSFRIKSYQRMAERKAARERAKEEIK